MKNYKKILNKVHYIDVDVGRKFTSACFSNIMSKKLEKMGKYILYFPKECTPFSKSKIKEYIKDINNWGFKIKQLSEYNDVDEVENYIFKIDSSNFNYGLEVKIVLTLYRYLFEHPFQFILDRYFKLIKKFNIKDVNIKFQLLQYAHFLAKYKDSKYLNEDHLLIYNTFNTNHLILYNFDKRPLSLEEVQNKLTKCNYIHDVFYSEDNLGDSDFYKTFKDYE